MDVAKGAQEVAGRTIASISDHERNAENSLTMFNIIAMFNYYETQKNSERKMASGRSAVPAQDDPVDGESGCLATKALIPWERKNYKGSGKTSHSSI